MLIKTLIAGVAWDMVQLDLRTTNLSTLTPLDVIEEVINNQGWRLNRLQEEEIAAEYHGRWCEYSLHFAWSREIQALHFTCAFDLRIPQEKTNDVNNLLALINDRLWLGHFCVWQEEVLPMFRHAFPLRGTDCLEVQQAEDLLEIAITECEKFYPAFQYVIWGNKKPNEALEASILEPIGQA